MKKFILKYVLFPWVLKNKGAVLGLLQRQDGYRNHVVACLYKTKMGWQNINLTLISMGMQTVKEYYMDHKGEPIIFFEKPTPERRAQIPGPTIKISGTDTIRLPRKNKK